MRLEMKALLSALTVFICIAFGACVNHTHHGNHNHHHTTIAPSTTTLEPMEAEVRSLSASVLNLGRQVMLQQLFVEERIRSDGNTGLKQSKLTEYGSRAYKSGTLANDNFAGISDAPYKAAYVEYGPNNYVINGVDFRIGKLGIDVRMPSNSSEDFGATEEITPPSVPPSVLSQPDVAGQIREMQLYFKAFQNQDKRIKADYDQYFKPVLCYMEAFWSVINESDVGGAFSQQNNIEAQDWLGTNKNFYENTYAPTTIMKVDDQSQAFAEWSYRTRCHPIQRDISRKMFFVRDDLASRISKKESFPDFAKSRAARFSLTGRGLGSYHPDSGSSSYNPDQRSRDVIESIMMEIPGFNNYPANLTDDSFNMLFYKPTFELEILNTAYYHRRFKVNKKGAMGLTISDKGFSDENLWVAQTTHAQIAPATVKECNKNGNHCQDYSVKYTYALPLEILWLTPLHRWNPYNLTYTPGVTSSALHGNGHHSQPYSKTDDEHFFITPAHFFLNAQDVTYVKDSHDNIHDTVASGISTLTQYIPGVGQVRLRYPIMPLHHDGYASYKEIEALKSMLLSMPVHAQYLEHEISGISHNASDCTDMDAVLTTSLATKVPPGAHTHDLFISLTDLHQLQTNRSFSIKTVTTLNSGHQHEIEIRHSLHHEAKNPRRVFVIVSCDGSSTCWDGHSKFVFLTRTPRC